MAERSARLSSLGPVLTNFPCVVCSLIIVLCISPCHVCLIIHSLEKRASRGQEVPEFDPGDHKKHDRADKAQRRISTKMGMKVMELPLEGQIGKWKTHVFNGLSCLVEEQFVSKAIGSLKLLQSHSSHTTHAIHTMSPCTILYTKSFHQLPVWRRNCNLDLRGRPAAKSLGSHNASITTEEESRASLNTTITIVCPASILAQCPTSPPCSSS